MPRIPLTGIGTLPTEVPPLPEDLSYHGIITKIGLSEKTDKNGRFYLNLSVKVTEPETYKGQMAFDNYICLPNPITTTMSGDERQQEENAGVRLAQLIAAGDLPFDVNGFDTDEWLNFEIEFTVKTDEYQGRKTNKVSMYLLSA